MSITEILEKLPNLSEEEKKQLREALTPENEKFVKEKVNVLLFSYAKTFFIVFGIANVLGVVGMWYSVRQTAIATATSEATQIADQRLKFSIEEIEKNISKLDQEYIGLVERKASLEVSIAGISSDLDTLKNTDKDKILSFAAAFNELKDKTDLSSQVGTLIKNNKDLTQQLEKANLEKTLGIPGMQADLKKCIKENDPLWVVTCLDEGSVFGLSTSTAGNIDMGVPVKMSDPNAILAHKWRLKRAPD